MTTLHTAKLLFCVAASLVIAGCQTYDPADSAEPPKQVADYLSGTWTATVEKHPDEDNIRNLNGPLSFEVGRLDGNTAALRGLASRTPFEGAVEMLQEPHADAAGAAIDAEGGVDPWWEDKFEDFPPMEGTPLHARLRFTTGDFQVATTSGPRTVKGPLQWTGVMRQGLLYGEVVGPAGRSTRWYATKN